MLTLANAWRATVDSSHQGLVCSYFIPEGDQDPALPSSPDKAALSPAETSGEQKQERIRDDGSTNMALSGFGSRFYSLGLSGNIWLAGRISILPQLIGRAANVSIFTSPAILCRVHPPSPASPYQNICRLLLSTSNNCLVALFQRRGRARRTNKNSRSVSKRADLFFTLPFYVFFMAA